MILKHKDYFSIHFEAGIFQIDFVNNLDIGNYLFPDFRYIQIGYIGIGWEV